MGGRFTLISFKPALCEVVEDGIVLSGLVSELDRFNAEGRRGKRRGSQRVWR